jgi:hypothetical protein
MQPRNVPYALGSTLDATARRRANARSTRPTSVAANVRINRLRFLHLDVGKRPAVQQSLLNDDTLKDFDGMTVVEPYIFRHFQTGNPTIAQDRRWEVFRPTIIKTDGHVRRNWSTRGLDLRGSQPIPCTMGRAPPSAS